MKYWYLISLVLPLQLLIALPASAKACSPYRVNYENAISQGLIERPSLVKSARQSWQLFYAAMGRNDRIEAASRAAQFLVIIAEGEGNTRADLAREQIKNEISHYYEQPEEVAVPMLEVILANSPDANCPAQLAKQV